MGQGIESAPGWQIARARAAAIAPSQDSGLQGLRQLLALRVFTPLMQVPTLLVATQHYGIEVPARPIALLIVAECVLAAATWQRVRRAARVSVNELFGQALADILLLAAMLYMTGGSANPFAPMFLLPMAIAASALPPVLVWATAAATMVAYLLLTEHHLPLRLAGGELVLHPVVHHGMVASYLIAAAMLAFFVNRTHTALRLREHVFAQAREAQMRSECVTSIGELAARCAHELSSPLATMAVVVNELMREHRANGPLWQDLRVLEAQIKASKDIVSNLSHTAGRRRAESAGGAKLDAFLHGIVDRARALHPGATIHAALGCPAPAPCILAEESLRQAVTSLIDHAADASPQHVEVVADWSGDQLRLLVQCRTGGFAPELMARMGKRLEPPQRGDVPDRDRGLLLSAIALERLGGDIRLANGPGEGTRAELRLPLATITIANREGTAVDGHAH